MSDVKNKYQNNGKYFNSPFAKALRELIGYNEKTKETKTSQEELGKIIGVKRQTISSYINGNTYPKVEELTKIAKYFNVSTDYLCGLTEAKTNNKDIQFICDYTGLSYEAVKSLTFSRTMGIDDNMDIFKAIREFIDFFIINSSTNYALSYAVNELKNYSEDELDNYNKQIDFFEKPKKIDDVIKLDLTNEEILNDDDLIESVMSELSIPIVLWRENDEHTTQINASKYEINKFFIECIEKYTKADEIAELEKKLEKIRKESTSNEK